MDPNGAVDAVQKAAGQSWEAAMLAVIIVSSLGFLVWLVKQWLAEAGKREDRMSRRIDILEEFQRTQLTNLAVQCREAVDRNVAAFDRLVATLADRPCLHPELFEQQQAALRNAPKQ
jgi:hypothetical protein